MKLADWARKQGIDYKTAYRLYRSGKFPRPTEQLPTGTILVHETPTATNNTALYARVSSADQKSDLERQMQRLRDYAAAQGLKVIKEVQETGSGLLNGHRKQLLKLLADPSISIIVVEHRDRLARFGAEEFISAALAAANRQLQVINQTECNDDLVQDMVDVLTSFCARLYGKRAAKNRAKRALEEATKDVD
ncbi:MAG: IS607 family transposase [Candidatus Freyarchaeum deiterrae]